MSENKKSVEIPYEIGTTVFGVFARQGMSGEPITYKLRVCHINDLQYFAYSDSWLLSVREVDGSESHNARMGENVFLSVEEAETKYKELQTAE